MPSQTRARPFGGRAKTASPLDFFGERYRNHTAPRIAPASAPVLAELGIAWPGRRIAAQHAELAVENAGVPNPAAARERLFQPFVRGEIQASQKGLGLDIAAEIARAHGGTLGVTSTADGTTFTRRMPVAWIRSVST